MTYEPMIHLYRTKLQEATDEAVLEMVLREVTKTGVMVDRAELLKALRYDRAQYEKGYADGRADAVKWISVAERLPEGECLAGCFTHGSYGYGEYIIGYVSPYSESEGSGYCAENSFEMLDDVTHWMPLPEPPKEEEHATD